MQPSSDELRKHYAEQSDSTLLRIAADRHTLTPEAEATLRQELALRQLDLPDLPQAPTTISPEPPAWVTVERFRDVSTAIVARSALEGAGIECFLRDENTVRLDWQISNFIGGLRLQVLAQDEEIARALLHQLAPDSLPEDEAAALAPEDCCPFCGSSDIHAFEPTRGLRAAALWLLTLPLPKARRRWHCNHCGKEFADSELAPTRD